MRYKIFALVAVVTLLGWGCSDKKAPAPPVAAPPGIEASAPVSVPVVSNLITVENQPLGNELVIKGFTLEAPGFIAIKEEANGKPFNLIGNSALLSPGIYTDSSFILIRKSKTGEKLFVQVYVDDGDGQLKLSSDQVAKDENGAPLMTQIVITGASITTENSATPSAPADPVAPTESAAKEVTVSITAAGFEPASVTIKAGDKVTWVNRDTIEHWVASALHPTHQVCPTLNSFSGLGPSDSFSVVFSDVKTCPYHDHLNPQLTGKVIVQ